MDWNLDIWRCEAWSEPLGSVFDLDRIPDQREPCHACMMACYRNASIYMHAGIAASDALEALAAGNVRAAAAALFRRSVAQSVRALIEELPHIRKLARQKGKRRFQLQSPAHPKSNVAAQQPRQETRHDAMRQ